MMFLNNRIKPFIIILLLLCSSIVTLRVVNNPDLNEKRSYDSFSSSSFAHNGEIEFVDKATYNILKSAYGKVDFSGKFRKGDTAVYDLYKKEYVKLIKGEADFYDRKTGEKLSIGDLQHEVNFEESLLMLFDMSGDGNPELYITDGARYKYVFKYNLKSDRFVLWADLGSTWYGLAGTQKVFWSRFQENNIFYILDENGNPNCTVYFHSKALVNDKTEQQESAYMVSMPEYAGKTVKYTKAMKSKRYFDEYHQKYFFRVTREQYDQLVAGYFKSIDLAYQQTLALTYTYEEMLSDCYQQETEEKSSNKQISEKASDIERIKIIFREFLCGKRKAKEGEDIDSLTIPTGEHGQRYSTKYAFFDSNGDGNPELHINSSRYYVIYTVQDEELTIWKDLSPNLYYFALKNGAFVSYKPGSAPMHEIYNYHIYNFAGDEVWNIPFSCYDSNENGSYDEDDEYLFHNIKVTQKQWEELTAKYLCRDSDGGLNIKNEIEWINLNQDMGDHILYNIVPEKFTKSDTIDIFYPTITGLADSGVQQSINYLLKTEAFTELTGYSQSQGVNMYDLSLSIQYEILYKNNDFLSVCYKGDVYQQRAVYPRFTLHPAHKRGTPFILWSSSLFLSPASIKLFFM